MDLGKQHLAGTTLDKCLGEKLHQHVPPHGPAFNSEEGLMDKFKCICFCDAAHAEAVCPRAAGTDV